MSTYNIGDTLLVHGTIWKVVRLFTGKDGSRAVALEDIVKPKYGTNPRTAFNTAVLDKIARKINL